MASEPSWIDLYKDDSRLTSRFQPMRGIFNLPPLRPVWDEVAVNRSINTRDALGGIPVVGALNEWFNPFQDEATGESRIAQGIGVDDLVWAEENARRGDVGGVLSGGFNALAEPLLLGADAAAGAGLAAKGLGAAGRGVAKAAAPRVTAFADDGTAKAVGSSGPRHASGKKSTSGGGYTPQHMSDSGSKYLDFLKRRKKSLGVSGGIAAGTGTAALVGAGLMARGDDTPQYLLDYYNNGAPAEEQDNSTVIDPILAVIGDNYAAQRALVEARQKAALDGYGDDQMATIMDFIDRYQTITDAQGQAVQGEMNALADRYGSDVGAIAAAGQAGAQGVNSVYGKAADRVRARSQRPGSAGRTAVTGLTPVSGALASAPGDLTDRGRTIADYVGGQAEIAARDAGYDAASAREYGAAMANTMGQQAAIAALAAEMNGKTRIDAQRQDMQRYYDDMLFQLQMQEQSDRADVQRMLAESEVQQQLAEQDRITFDDVMMDPNSYATALGQYENLNSTDDGKRWLQSKGIRSLPEFIEYQVATDEERAARVPTTEAPATSGGVSPLDWLLGSAAAGASVALPPLAPLFLAAQSLRGQ